MYVLGQNLGMGKFNGVFSFPLIFRKEIDIFAKATTKEFAKAASTESRL